MVWTKLDDGLWRNPTIRGLSHGEFRLYVCALNWSVDQLTDGEVSVSDLVAIMPKSELRTLRKYADGLVAHRLWTCSLTGWSTVGYALYQPTKEQVKQQRELANQRQKAYRDRQKPDTVTHNAQDTVTHNGGVMSHDPDPTRPDPSTTSAFVKNVNTAAAPQAAADDLSESIEWATDQWGLIRGITPNSSMRKAWVKNVTEFVATAGLPSVEFMRSASAKGIRVPAGWLHVWESPPVDTSLSVGVVDSGSCSHRWSPIDNDEPTMDQCVKCHLYRGGDDSPPVCACQACSYRSSVGLEAELQKAGS
jgi:hypothetical protein